MFNILLDGGEDNDFTFVNKPTATSAMTVIISGDESSGSLSVNGVSDALANIESVSVLSGSGRDTLDGSAYFGTVTLMGNGGDAVLPGSCGAGDDTLYGEGEPIPTKSGQAIRRRGSGRRRPA